MLAWVKVSTLSLLKKKPRKERERKYSAKRATLFPGLTFFRMNSVYVRLISRNSNGHNALYNARQSWPVFYWRQIFFYCFLIVPFLLLTLGRTCKFIPPPWYKGGWMDPPQTFWYVAVFRNDFTFKGCDHGYAHARRLSLQNKFVGSALNSKSPLLVQSLKILLFIPISVALAGLVILW